MVSEVPASGPSAVIAIGETKATFAQVGSDQLDRLEHLRSVLPAGSSDRRPKLLPFARSGFTPELRSQAAGRTDVELVDLERMYRGE